MADPKKEGKGEPKRPQSESSPSKEDREAAAENPTRSLGETDEMKRQAKIKEQEGEPVPADTSAVARTPRPTEDVGKPPEQALSGEHRENWPDESSDREHSNLTPVEQEVRQERQAAKS